MLSSYAFIFFFFNDTATTEIYTLSLHDALPISYARVNEFGFIEAPYRKVRKGKVTDEIEHLSAIDGDRYHIAQANSEVGPDGRLIADLVSARYGGGFVLGHPDKVEYMEVSPQQTGRLASALIPFP